MSLASTRPRVRKVVVGVAAVVPLFLALGIAPPAHAADVLGIVMDNSTRKAVVFDATTNSVLGSVGVPSGGAVGDCNIVSGLGFTTSFDSNVHVIQLTPPALASYGPNSIPIANNGEDVSWSSVTNMLYASDGAGVQPLSIIDPSTRRQVGTFATGNDNDSVTVVGDSVIATSFHAKTVRRFTPKGSTLFDTGESLTLTNSPNNVITQTSLSKPPSSSTTALVITNFGDQLTSFTVPGLTPVSTVTIPGTGLGSSGVISPDGTKVFVRTATDVVGYSYNLASGAIGAMLFDKAIPEPFPGGGGVEFGMDQLALYPDGSRLLVPTTNAVNVISAVDGSPITTITDPSIVAPTGVCLVNATE